MSLALYFPHPVHVCFLSSSTAKPIPRMFSMSQAGYSAAIFLCGLGNFAFSMTAITCQFSIARNRAKL